MNEFTHEMFGRIRTVEVDGEPLFVLSDVAKALGYTRTSDAKKHLRDSQFSTADRRTWADQGGRGSAPTIVTESGLYRLVLKSEAANAEKFQDWVTDEVLPTIRKTGRYDMGEHDAPAWARELMSSVDAIVYKARAHDAVHETSKGYPLAVAARRMGVGHHRLCEILREEGLTRAPGSVPTQKGLDSGLIVRRANVAVVPEEAFEDLSRVVMLHVTGTSAKA